MRYLLATLILILVSCTPSGREVYNHGGRYFEFPAVCDDLSRVEDTPVIYVDREVMRKSHPYQPLDQPIMGTWEPIYGTCMTNPGPQGIIFVREDQPDWGIQETLRHEYCHEAACRFAGNPDWHGK